MHPSGRRSGGILRLYARSEHFVDPVPAAETRELFSCGIRPDGAFCVAEILCCRFFGVCGVLRRKRHTTFRSSACGTEKRIGSEPPLTSRLETFAVAAVGCPAFILPDLSFLSAAAAQNARQLLCQYRDQDAIKTQSRRKPAVRRRAQWRAPFAAAAKVLIRRLSRRLRTYHSRKNLPV